jgi:zinc D-Ala-D-Ala dipeptidase
MIAFEHPIPIVDRAPTAEDYHDIPIDLRDPRNLEPLVDARDWGLAGENYYSRTDGQNPPYHQAIRGAIRQLWCRQTIAAQLRKVNELLAQYGAELFLWDAYRPISCQIGLWDFFLARFRIDMGDSAEERIIERVQQYVSDPTLFDPTNPKTWPVHTTGGAVDLTLRDCATGQLLDMGTHFDEMSEASHSDHFERLRREGLISSDDVRLCNRRLLHWAMREQGFTNYSYEFWHFDLGDQMYIMSSRHQNNKDSPRAAWYGYVPVPPSRM